MANEEYVDVQILKEHYEAIEKIVASSGQFQSVTEYLNFALKNLLSSDKTSGYTKEEEEIIKKRLEDLGYM